MAPGDFSDGPPRVFVSYAHESPEHEDQVLRFASFLRDQGIEAVLDTWFAGDRRDWYAWAIKEMTGADYVIVIASRRYRRVGDGSGPVDLHQGVQSEAALLRDLVYGDRGHWLPKVLPVILDGHDRDEIPLFLQPNTASRFEVRALTVAGATELLRVIVRQPARIPPPVAARRVVLPTIESPPAWGDIAALPDTVRSLLQAQALLASELPYRLPGARRPLLASIYVRQELGSGTDTPQPEQPQTEQARGNRVPMSLPEPPTVRLVVRPPARPIRVALDGADHLLVTGGPGQGKSTLSLRLAADIVAAWGAADGSAPLSEPVIPIRLTAREVAARLNLPFAQALAESIQAEYGALLRATVNAAQLGGKLLGRRWLLLIDGLDEVANAADRDRLVTVLAACVSDPAESPYRVVLTTRPTEGATLAPFQEAGAARYELQSFDEKALHDFAASWFVDEGQDVADRFVLQIRRTHLDELVRVPLLATIAAVIFAEYRDLPLPDNQYELYELYLEYLRSARPSAASPFEPIRSELLEHLGRVRLESDAPLGATAIDWYAQHVAAGRRPVNWRNELMDFLTSAGPLMMRGDELRFLHHSFAEHLAATSMARQLPEVWEEDHQSFVDLLYASREEVRGRYPRTVLLHYTQLRHAEADPLLRTLLTGTAENHLLAARLLAKHLLASSEMIDEFLFIARAWAMTDHYPSRPILKHTTRATHHPGLVSWLVELSNDDKAPWPSRIRAAIALARRVDDDQAKRAGDLLETVMGNEDLPITYRLDAAEGLAECDAERRKAAQAGLQLLMADSATPATRRRGAAVTLAGLGAEAHDQAVDVLMAVLEDRWSPIDHLVEAATALAEIGLEFHERCAMVFRSILHTTQNWSTVRNAARALAALGPRYLADAVDVLIAYARSRKHNCTSRALAVETLRELGPQFGAVAAELVFDLLVEPGAKFHEQTRYAHSLAKMGLTHRGEIGTVLSKMAATVFVREHFDFDIVDGLNELGSEFHGQTAQLLRAVVEDPLSSGSARSVALERLMQLGRANRTYVIDRLRGQLCDHAMNLSARNWAAYQLAKLGPELHHEVRAYLVSFIGQDPQEHEQVAWVCSLLDNLGTGHRDAIVRMLSAVLRFPFVSCHSLLSAATTLAGLATEYRVMAGVQLGAILADTSRCDAQRIAAAMALIDFGRQYDGQVLEGLLDMLNQTGVDLPSESDWFVFAGMGAYPRQELTNALLAQMSDAGAGPRRVVDLARAINLMSPDHTTSLIEALETIIADNTAEVWPRFDAATMLADIRPDRRDAAILAITRCVEPINVFWTLSYACSALVAMDHDPTPMISAVLADPNSERALREETATLLSKFGPSFVDSAVAELRYQVWDQHLGIHTRGDIMMGLVELDLTNRGDAIALLRPVLEDDEQPIWTRCRAAELLARFDRSLWRDAVMTVRQLLSNPLTTPSQRLTLVEYLDQLNAISVDERRHAAKALAWEPTLDSARRNACISMLHGEERLEAQRSQLENHCARILDRIPNDQNDTESPPLRIETEAAIREVLSNPGWDVQDRIDAAVALAAISCRFISDAAKVLAGIAEDITTSGRFVALTQMAWLDSPARLVAMRRVEALMTDASLSRRYRQLAAETLIHIDYTARPKVLDFLRSVVGDETLAGHCRVNASYTLRHIDGPNPLRALRDDTRLPAAVRIEAATKLIAFTVDDRATAARMLGDVAARRESIPALRVRALETLADLGVPGRRQAIEILTTMTRDDEFPVSARIDAAQQLAWICPTRRPEMIEVLRTIRLVAKPIQRIAVLTALGEWKPDEAISGLRAIAADPASSPVARLRAADRLAHLSRHHHETAALTARELMHSDTVSWHIRRRAAVALARLSIVCRQEANDLIIKIDSDRTH